MCDCRLDDEDEESAAASAEERLTVRWQGEGRPLSSDTNDNFTPHVYEACRLIFKKRRQTDPVKLQPGEKLLFFSPKVRVS